MDKIAAHKPKAAVAAATDDGRGPLVVKARGGGKRSTVKFGGVTVVVPRPSSAQLKLNVAASTEALERVTKRLERPGVRLYAKKDVPLYSADPRRPGVYIRVLNGKTELGIVENGAFKVID
jgi:hypothetical protein